jgi:hypothetical protein
MSAMSSYRSFASSEISEKALLDAMPKIKDVFADMEESIREASPRLYHVNGDDYDDDDEEENPSKRAKQVKAGSGSGSGSGSTARPEFTMEMGLDLKITDTDAKYATFAHKQLLALLESSSECTLFAKHCGLSFVRHMLAALSTPTAAFYADLTPARSVHRRVYCLHSTLLTDTTEALRQEVTDIFVQERIGANPRLMADHATGRDRMFGCKAWVDCSESFDRLVDLAMEKYTAHLAGMRAYWESKPVPTVQAMIIKFPCPPPPQPVSSWTRQLPTHPQQVEIIRMQLPLSVVPISSLQENSVAVQQCFTPSAQEIKMVRVLDGSGTLDNVKYCLMNWILANEQKPVSRILYLRRQVVESRTANFLVVKHLTEYDE